MGAPKIVIDLFKSPRNKRAMADATARGVLRAREPGKELVLYLRVANGLVADASFTNSGDRMDDAPLSMLTTLIKGKPLDEVRRLDQLAIARALESEAHPGIAFPAHEVLRNALFAVDGKAPPDPGPLVCHCFHVHQERIERAVRERSLDSVEDVNRFTRACGGCRSCRPDIEKLIQRVLGRPARDA